MSQDSLLRLANVVFQFSLSMLLLCGTVFLVLGNPAAIKKAAHDSKIYDAAAPIVRAEAINLDVPPSVKPALESAAGSSFTASYLQSASEQVIDGSYHWLKGKSDQPDFKIDASVPVNNFMTAVGEEATKYAQQLSACRAGDLSKVGLADTNLLTLQCLPPGTTPAMVRDATLQHLQEANILLKDPVITTDTLTNATNSRNAFDKLSVIPPMFRAVMMLPMLFLGGAAISAAFVFVLYNNVAKAGYSLAKGLLWASLPILLFGVAAHIAFNVLTQPGGSITKSVDGTFQQYGADFIRSLETTFAKTLLILSGITAVVGGVAAGWFRMRAQTPLIPSTPHDDSLKMVEMAKNDLESEAPVKKKPLTVHLAAPVGTTVAPDPEVAARRVHEPPEESQMSEDSDNTGSL